MSSGPFTESQGPERSPHEGGEYCSTPAWRTGNVAGFDQLDGGGMRRCRAERREAVCECEQTLFAPGIQIDRRWFDRNGGATDG